MTEDEKMEHRQFLESTRVPAFPLTERLLMLVILSPIILVMLPWYIYGAVGDPYDKQARA